jgi:hypothetical protein
MDFESIVSLISTIGFPIVCCLMMGWYVKYISDANRVEIDKINERHRAEMTEVTTAINNNTLALTKLCERLGDVSND